MAIHTVVLQEADHTETDGDGNDDSDVYTPEIATSHRVHPDAVSSDSDCNGGDVIASDDIAPTTQKPVAAAAATVSREDKQRSVESCTADIGNLGVPVDSSSAESNSVCGEAKGSINQGSSTGEIIM